MKPGAASSRSGFTLVELLVAIGVLSLLVLLLAGGVRMAMALFERAEERARLAEDVPLIHLRLRRMLEGMVPLEVSSASGRTLVLFEGNPHELFFVGRLPEMAGGGLWRLQLHRVGTEHGRFVLNRYPLESETNPAVTDGLGESVLLQDVVALNLSYFGSDSSGTPPRWWSTWREAPRLPELVRIEIVFPDRDERQWPPLSVHPMVDLAF